MSAFHRFGIERLSPSSLNCWIATPGMWCLRYLAKVKDESSPAALRGTSVEKGMEALLRGESLTAAIKIACAEFRNATQGEITDDIEAEAALIPNMLGQCAKFTADMPMELAASQLKIEARLDGVSVPVIGYVDFTHIDGPDIDLKTTKACPSKPRPEHLRQVALYWHARQRPAALLYVTDKRFAYYCPPENDLEIAVNDLATAARSLERFLSVVPDAETAIRCLPMDRDHYTWSQAAEIKMRELEEAF